MAPSSPIGQNSHISAEEHANILNDLALSFGQKQSSPVGVGASGGRRYPTRERDILGQPLRTSARLAGKLKRPSRSRARDISGISKVHNATRHPGFKIQRHASSAVPKSNNIEARSSSRANAENSDTKELTISDIDTQRVELSIQEEYIDHQSSRLLEKPGEHTEYLELFGQESAWEEVLEGARSVGVSKSGIKSLPRLTAPTIRHIVKNTKHAKGLFNRLSQERDMNKVDDDELKAQLERAIAEINEKVIELNEAAAGGGKSGTIKGVYAHAIPNLVFMLQSALQFRTRDYGNLGDVEFLRSMISIQDIILVLCRKAASWKAEAYHETPIVRPTRQKIRPNLREVRKAFQAELDQRERLSTQQQRERMLAKAHERRFEKMMKEKEENVRKRRENLIKMKEGLDRNHEMLFGPKQRERTTNRQIWSGDEHQDGYPNHPDESTDQWTDEENLELMVQLQNPESRHLPGLYLAHELH